MDSYYQWLRNLPSGPRWRHIDLQKPYSFQKVYIKLAGAEKEAYHKDCRFFELGTNEEIKNAELWKPYY